MFGFTWKESGMAAGLKAYKEYSLKKADATKDWLITRPWRTAIVVTLLALVTQLIVWVGTGYYHTGLIPLAVAGGVYVFTSLRWLQEDKGWHSVFMGIVMIVCLGLALKLIGDSFSLGTQNVKGATAIMIGGVMLVLCALATFIEDKPRSWLHVRGPMVVLVASWVWLGFGWAWLGLVFPAVALILIKVVTISCYIANHLLIQPVFEFVKKDRLSSTTPRPHDNQRKESNETEN